MNNYHPFPQYYPQQYTQQQAMTPPTIHAEIVQVEGEDMAYNYPVAAGVSQMMISRDETAIYIKSAYSNGQSTLDVYEKRKPKPQVQSAVDMSAYVTRDELEGIINKMMEERGHGSIQPVGKPKEQQQ